LSIQNTGNITVNNYSGSEFRVIGNLDIQSSTINTTTSFNLISGKTSFDVTGNFNSSKGILSINPTTTANQFSEGVFFNIGKDFYIGGNATLNMNIGQGSYFNVGKVASFDGRYNKTINNYGGVININSSFNIGGNGQNTGVFSLLNTNNGAFSIRKAFNASYNNGTVNIVNDASINIGTTWTQSKEVTTVTNNGKISITRDLNIERGSFINNGNLYARDGDIKFGVFTNNYSAEFSRDLITSNNSATINNNKMIIVAGELNNKANINISLNSVFNVTHYVNDNNGIINGPTAIITDSTNYPKIIISNTSSNSGYLNGRMMIWDQTINANNPVGFDSYNNTSRIGLGIIVVRPLLNFYCLFINFLNPFTISATPNPVCVGGSVTLDGPNSGSLANLANSAYVWNPGTVAGKQKIVTVTTAQIFTLNITFAGCTLRKTIAVTIVPNPVVTISSNLSPICLGSGLVLSSPAVSGATSYQWFSGTTPIVGETALSFVPTTAGSYYLKVNNSTNCSSNSNTLAVLQSPIVNITPTSTTICSGGSSLLSANVSGLGAGSISNYQWQQNGGNVGANLLSYLANNAGSYVVTVLANNGCSATSIPSIVNLSNILASAGSSSIITTAGPITLSGSASGGIPTYNYLWTPTSAFSPSSNSTLSNPVVHISANSTFNLTVTDNAGCSSSDYVSILFLNDINSYGVLKKAQDGGFYQVTNNKVYFKFEEEYKGIALNYNVYNYASTTVNTPINLITTCSDLNVINTTLGDNRYSIDLTNCGSLIPNNYYLLEIINSKKEKFYLKFKI
jgi:hypothetical protein